MRRSRRYTVGTSAQVRVLAGGGPLTGRMLALNSCTQISGGRAGKETIALLARHTDPACVRN